MDNRGNEMEKLMESEKGFLWSQALRITGKTEDAEDLFQDTMMKAFKGFNRFKRDTNFRAWARKIMINTHINNTRQKMPGTISLDDSYLNYENTFSLTSPRVSETNYPARVFFHNHINGNVMELFYSLPEENKLVFALFHFEGYSYNEISKALNIPAGTVKSRIHRARQYLSEKIHDMRLAGKVFH